MGRGRPTPPLELTESERSVLLHQTRQRTGPHQSVLRACIILGCADGRTNTAVAKELGICKQTAGKWRSRFLRDRLDGLQDAPRLGTPRSIDDEKIMEVVNNTNF